MIKNIRKLIHLFYALREILFIKSLERYGIIIWGDLYIKFLNLQKNIQQYILKILTKKK